jgi:hypothetical protein
MDWWGTVNLNWKIKGCIFFFNGDEFVQIQRKEMRKPIFDLSNQWMLFISIWILANGNVYNPKAAY